MVGAAGNAGATAPFQGRSHEFAQVIAQAIAGMNVMVARKILPGLSGVADTMNKGGNTAVSRIKPNYKTLGRKIQ